MLFSSLIPQKKAPDRNISVKDEFIDSRCHLDLQLLLHARQDTDISPAVNVCPHVAEYLAFAFDCALGGPFDDLFSARFSASRALCKSIITVISASTVSYFIKRQNTTE